MNPTLLLFLIVFIAVAVFVIGMSLTLIIKGRHIDSEIGDNKHMQERGIKCAAQQMRDEEHSGENSYGENIGCSDQSCVSCSVHSCDDTTKPDQVSSDSVSPAK